MYRIEDVLQGNINITAPDEQIERENKLAWDQVAKPLDSMGRFETYLSRIGAIQKKQMPSLEKGRLYVFCADNGIVEEGISQSDQSITAICAENIGKGISSVGVMAAEAGMELVCLDMGMNTNQDFKYVRNEKIRRGTCNFLKQPAMTKEEALKAMQIGMNLVKESKEDSVDFIAMGEMGIGNTTTSSAMAASLLKKRAKEVTGKGAGLSDAGLIHKIEVIQKAIDQYHLYDQDPLEILCHVGGFDIAGMIGLCIGGAVYGVPVILDGLISMVSALCAARMVTGIEKYFIPSHTSREPAAKIMEDELNLHPVIDAGMALGEGTGAVMSVPLFRMALSIYASSTGFESAGIEAYSRK